MAAKVQRSPKIQSSARKADIDSIDLEEPSDTEADEKFLEELYSKRSFIRDELRIVLIGKTGSGKSATGNTIVGSKAFESKLSGSSITAACADKMVERFGRHIQVVDTPGLFDTPELFDTRDSNKEIEAEIRKCVFMTSPGIHALILISKVGRFTEEEKQTVDYFKKVFGEGLSNFMMIVFTGKDDLYKEKKTVQEYIKSSPAALQELVSQSHNRYMTVNNRSSMQEKDAFAKELITRIEKMVQENGSKCYTSTMFRKAEAIMKKREEEERKRLEEEKKAEREAIANDIKEKYDEVLNTLESKIKDLQKDLESMHKKEQEEQKKHQQAVESLKLQLENAEAERKKIEVDRKHWEDERRKEMEKIEKDRNEAMLMMMDKLRQRENEMDKMIRMLNEERRQREEEIERREEELERREEDERGRIEKLKEEHEEELKRLRDEQRLKEEEFERQLEEKSREIARQGKESKSSCSIL